jgi:hypothetical protein
MPQFLPLPDGSSLKLREGESPQAGWARAFEAYPEAFGFDKPQAPVEDTQGFMAGIRSGIENLKGDVGALGAGLGIEGGEAYARAQAAKAAELYQQPKFTEAPVDYVTGMLGQSLPYIAAPLAAAGAAATLPLTGVAATAAGLGAAGLASATQFTGSNLARQLDEGRTTDTLELGNAALAAIPQAALDTLSLKLLPGIGRIFGTAGKELTEDGAQAAARAVLARGTGNLVKQYGGAVLKTAGIEGLTETGQQVLERAQAELEMLDPEARGEYLDSFIGGALLGGTLAVPGKAFERGADRRKLAEADKRKAAEQAAEAARTQAEYEKTDAYALDVAAKYENARTQLAELEGQKRKAKKGTPTFDEDTAHNKAIGEQQKALREETDFKALAEQYKALGPRLASIELSRFTESERAAPTADKLYVQSPQATIPGLDAVEDAETEAEAVAPAQLMEQRQYLDRLLTDNQERMSTAAASADVNAIKILQQQRSMIRADIGAVDERLKASGFVDTAGQAQQLQQDIARAQQQLQKMAGPGFDPDKASKIIERIEKAQAQLAELGGDQQALDMGAPRKLSDPVAEAAKFDTERTKRDLEERQQLMGQQRVTPEGQPDMFAESMEDVETQRREGETNFDYLDDIFEKALNQDVPAVTAPEGVVFSEKSQGLLDRLDALEAQTASAKTAEERKALEARRSALAATSDADPNLRVVYDLRSQSEDALLDLESAVDDLRTGTFFGGDNVGAASTNEQGLFKRAEEAKKNYIRAVLQEAAALRRIRNEKGLTADEALKAADQINTELDELLNRSQAVREVEEVITQPAQMRGTKIVSPAKTERRDVRPLEQRPFAKYRAALGTIMDSVDNTRRALTAPSKAQARADAPVLKTQFAETEAKRVAEERGETATTLSGELRRRAEFVRNKMARMKGGMRPAARDLLNKAADVLDEGKPTRDILDATETVVDSILRGQMPLERDLRALKDALAATQETPAGQKDLFDTTTDRRRKDQEVGVIRQSAEAFNKAPAVVKARAAVDRAREEVEKIEANLTRKRTAERALQAIRSRIADLENKINSTLERTKPAARSANSFFSLSPTFVKRLDASELANATPERRAEYAAALKVEAQYQAMRQEFDEKFKREGAASRAAVTPLQETKAVLDKQEKAFAKRISDLEQLLQDPALVAASKARADAKDLLAGKASDLQAQVDEQRAELQAAMDRAVAALRPAFDATEFATNPSVVSAKKNLDAAEEALFAAEAALNKTREQINTSGDIGASLKLALVYDQQRNAIDPAKKLIAPARELLEDAMAKAQAEYDKTALIAQAYQDGMVKVELDALNRLEKRLVKVRTELGMASPEARAVQQEMAAQQKALDLAEAQRRESRELAAKQQRQYDERMLKGFGLPFTRRVDGKVQEYADDRKTEADNVKERFERYAADVERIETGDKAQMTKRARGPVTRTQSAAPAAMRTGTTESREGVSRTQTDMRTTEARGEAERDVAMRSSEMQEANRLAELIRNKTPAQKRKEVAEAEAVARELEKSQRKAGSERGILDADDAVASVVRDSQYDGRPTTELSGPVKADIRAGRLEDALLRLQDEGSTPFVRQLAKRLAPLVKNVTLVSRPDVVDSKGVPVEALYFGKDMQIQVNSTSGMTEEAFMHEVVHPATLSVLTADPATLSPEQRAARQEVEALFAQIQNDPKFSREYAKFSVAEMVSEIMSNNKLRNMLDQRGVLGRIYDAILRMLGVSPKSVSDQAVENIYALFAPAKPIEAVKVASVMRGVFPGTAPIGNSDMPANVSNVVDKLVAKRQGVIGKIMANVSGLAFRTQFIDRFAPIEELLRKGVERKLIPAMQSFQTQYFLRFGEQRNQFLQQSVSNGVVQLNRAADGTFTIDGKEGPNLANIAKILNDAGLGNEQNVEGLFTTYLAGIRAKQDGVGIEKLNFENKITQADLNAVNAYIESNPKARDAFKKARDEYNAYNKNLLKFVAQSGAITPEEAARLSSKEYVPYYREDASGVVNLVVGSEKPIRIGNITDQPYLKELVGGNEKILPIFTGAMQNTSLLLDMALRNLQTKDVANTLSKMDAAKIGEGAGPNGKNVVRFKQNGKPMYAIIGEWVKDPQTGKFEMRSNIIDGVPAELIVQGMEGIKTLMPFAVKLLGKPADLLRKGVTRNPAYAVRQIFRDSVNSWLTTGGSFTPVLSSLKEMGSMVAGRSDNERILQQAGAISSNVFSGDRGDWDRILRDISTGKGMVDRLLSKADAFAMQGDAATRAVLYNKYREQGMTHMQALLGALESMNFARRGLSPSMQYLSTMIPFFNAQIQGLDVIYRAAVGKTTFENEMDVRSKLLTRGFVMAASTMAYAALMQDDEAYKNATPKERAQNWFVYLPGMDEPLRVPIPFELGMAFKAIPEMVFNTAFGDQEVGDAAKTIGKLAYDTVPIGLPQGVKPMLEVMTNYSLFSDASITSQREQMLTKPEQFRANTSELAKLVGSANVLSPIQLEYLVRGYTGSLGVLLMQMANPLFRPFNSDDMPEGPTKKVSQMPILGALFQPTDGRGIIDAAYEQADDMQKASNTYKRMIEQGRRADAQAFAQKYSAEIAGNTFGGSFRQQMGDLAKVRRAIESSKDLTPEQKRVRIDGIRQIELKLAQRVREYGKTTLQ